MLILKNNYFYPLNLFLQKYNFLYTLPFVRLRKFLCNDVYLHKILSFFYFQYAYDMPL